MKKKMPFISFVLFINFPNDNQKFKIHIDAQHFLKHSDQSLLNYFIAHFFCSFVTNANIDNDTVTNSETQ